MADETDEVKLFRVQEEDESDAPSLADDKKDVALEEEMESKPGAFGGLSAFHAPPSTPSSALPMGFPPFSPGMSPFPFQQLAAFSNWQLNQAAANVALTNAITAALSPVYPPLPSSPMNSVVDMYRNLGALAALSPLTGGHRVGMMPPFRPYTPMQLMGFGGIGGGMNHPSTSSAPATPSGMRRKRTVKEEDKEEHIKKPKNAYFWFMDENRKVLMNEEEWKDKQSADLNKELGKRWHDMKEEDKRPYFEMAAKDKEDHAKKYPNWSARENYANSAKKKKKRDRTTEPGEGKKCRARFGVDAQDRWCKHCVRKKKCLHTGGGGEDDEKEEREERASSHSTHQRATDSESDLDDEPTTIPSDEDLKTSMTLTPLTPSFALNQLMLK
nr:POP-1 [Pristionchus pacificus]